MDYYDAILQTYELEEILEINEVTEAETLQFLVEREFVKLPNPMPVDVP